MSQLTGKAVVAIYHLSVDDDSAAYARSQGDHYEVLHSPGNTVGHLSHRSRIGVIGEGDRNAVHCLGEHLCEWNRLAGGPGEVRGVCDDSLVIVAVRGSDAYAAYVAFLACFGYGGLYGGCEGFDVGCGVNAVYVRAYHFLREDVTACVNYSYLGGLSTYVDTDYVISCCHINLLLCLC